MKHEVPLLAYLVYIYITCVPVVATFRRTLASLEQPNLLCVKLQ